MKVNELRIGNWYNHLGEFKQVTPNTILEVWEAQRQWCKPIPLTPEILEKAGFKDDGSGSGWYMLNYFTDCELTAEVMCLQVNTISFRCAISDTDYDSAPSMTAIRMNYVHQLQNLYFALTGEELNINL